MVIACRLFTNLLFSSCLVEADVQLQKMNMCYLNCLIFNKHVIIGQFVNVKLFKCLLASKLKSNDILYCSLYAD